MGLWIRRLLLHRQGERRGYGGVTKKRRRTSSGATIYTSSGTTFGCTLGNLLQYAKGRKVGTRVARDRMEMCMEPALAAALQMKGGDKHHLLRGMGGHCVIGHLGSKLSELASATRLREKTKQHAGVAYGAVASVMVVFAIMSSTREDEEALEPCLVAVCKEVDSVLLNWRGKGAWTRDQEEALAAEQRASERAVMAVKVARTRAQDMSLSDSLRLQLSFMRRAVWPAGEDVGVDTQEELKKRLLSGELVDLEKMEVPGAMNAPGVLPLSALPFAERAVHRDETASHRSDFTGESWSSLGSWSSSGSLGSVGSGGSVGSAVMVERPSDVAMCERLARLNSDLRNR